MSRNPQQNRKTATAIRHLDDDSAALDLRRQGLSYPAIAAELGCSVSTAYGRVRRCFDAALAERDETAEQIIAMELERLDDMLAAIWKDATNGNLRAIDRALKISERRMKILGLERERMELTGPDGGPVAVDGSYQRIKDKLDAYAAAAGPQLVEGA